MLNEFIVYLQLGLEHILDFAGYDHLLFIVSLCAAYPSGAWRKIALLITAFTLGHCLTLLLAGRYGNLLAASLTEQLVAFSIFLSGAYAFYAASKENRSGGKSTLTYGLAAGFGLIHGLAFSNFFRALGSSPSELWRQLLAFNLGVEIGQLIIVAAYLACTALFTYTLSAIATQIGPQYKTRWPMIIHRWWSMLIAASVAIVGLILFINRLG